MRFLITMNMPSKSGNAIHQIIAEHPAESIDEMREALESNDFIEIEEFYKNLQGDYYSTGRVLINHKFVGKVRAFVRNTHAYNDH